MFGFHSDERQCVVPAFVVCACCFNFYKRSLVTGWEARDQSNQVVVDRTLGSFAYGVRKGLVKRIVISNKNKKAVLDWAK